MNAQNSLPDEQWVIDIFSGQLDLPHAAHPSFGTLHGYTTRALEPAWHERVRLHVVTCSRCAREVQQLLELQDQLTPLVHGVDFADDPQLQGEADAPVALPGMGQKLILLFQQFSLKKHTLVYAAAMLLLFISYGVLDGWFFVRPRMLTVPEPTPELSQGLRLGMLILGLVWSGILGLHALVAWRKR